MHTEQRAKTLAVLQNRGIERALFTHPASITWLTGFAAPLQTGPSPFSGGPPLVWVEEGQFTLIIQEEAKSLFRAETDPDLVLRTYPGYTLEHGFPGVDNLYRVFDTIAAATGSGTIGIENISTPFRLAAHFLKVHPTWVNIDGILEPVRMIKTYGEIETMKEAFRLAEIGHAAARSAVHPGLREIDLWAEIQAAIEREAGQRVPLGNDCVVSARRNNIGGWPEEHRFKKGDSVVVDLGVRINGYWSDSCATYFSGQPSEKALRAHSVVLAALEFAISLVKPGIAAGEIDRQVRAFMEKAGYPVYPHHTGHGIGVSPHEAPRLVPGNPLLLEPGMILMLEPGIYYPGELAVRLEDAVLVTNKGARVLTGHEKWI